MTHTATLIRTTSLDQRQLFLCDELPNVSADDPLTDDPLTDDPLTDDPLTDDPLTDDPLTDTDATGPPPE